MPLSNLNLHKKTIFTLADNNSLTFVTSQQHLQRN